MSTTLPTYKDLEAFYKACPAASRSGESDYGVHNHDDLGVFAGLGLPSVAGRIRVAHVHNTGHFYAFAHFATGNRVALLGQVAVRPTEQEAANLYLMQAMERAVYEHFEDYAYGEGAGRPLSWFVERIAELQEKEPAAASANPALPCS